MNKPVDRINLLLQSGLASDIRRIAYYRAVMQQPKDSFNNTVYRNLAGEILDKLIGYVLNDAQIFNRLRQLLLDRKRLKEDSLESLIQKAQANNIPLETILEVYERGTNQSFPLHLSPEQRGFSRVNSFLAGGKARQDDRDLFEQTTLKTIKKIITEKKYD